MNIYFYFTASYTFFSLIMFSGYFKVMNWSKIKLAVKTRNVLMSRYKKVIKSVIFNVYVLTIPIYFLDQRYTNKYNNQFILYKETVYFILNLAISEILFYTFHRILHHRLLYKHFHKVHHEFKQPIGISALYTHPVDAVLGNIIPDGIGLYILWSTSYYYQILGL